MSQSASTEQAIALKLIEFSESPIYSLEKNIVYRVGGRKNLSAAKILGDLPEVTFTIISQSPQVGEVSIKKQNIETLERFKGVAA